MTFELMPFVQTPERAEIISYILRNVARHETLFSGFASPCEASCVTARTLPEMCHLCKLRMATVATVLSAPSTRTFEVWDETPAVVGIIYFSDIAPSLDAKGHYVFFDGKLNSKTAIVQEAIDAMMEEFALSRLTIEIPVPFVALAKHAARKLGFGGRFRYKGGLMVEGVKRDAARWRGELVDLLILGRARSASTKG